MIRKDDEIKPMKIKFRLTLLLGGLIMLGVLINEILIILNN